MLLSADIDADVFLERFIASGAHRLTKRVTLYVGTRDPVMSIAGSVRIKYPRAGGLDLMEIAQ